MCRTKKIFIMINWKKVTNFLFPLTAKEIVSLMKAHMVKVCGKSCENINPREMKLVETDYGRNMAIIYFWDNLFWEVNLDREVAAYCPDVAEQRYLGEKFDFPELECSTEVYKLWFLQDGITVKIWGKSSEKLRFRKGKNIL